MRWADKVSRSSKADQRSKEAAEIHLALDAWRVRHQRMRLPMNHNLPALPDQKIKPNQPVVVFLMHECRACGEVGPWVRVGTEEERRHVWDVAHQKQTGHGKYYQWSITRSIVQVFNL